MLDERIHKWMDAREGEKEGEREKEKERGKKEGERDGERGEGKGDRERGVKLLCQTSPWLRHPQTKRSSSRTTRSVSVNWRCCRLLSFIILGSELSTYADILLLF